MAILSSHRTSRPRGLGQLFVLKGHGGNAARDEWRNKACIDVLLKDFDVLRTELRLHAARYQDIVKHAQIVTWTVFAAYAYVITNTNLLPTKDTWLAWWAAAIMLVTVVNYLVLAAFESQFATVLFASRLEMIEREINKRLGAGLLLWETSALTQT